MSSRQSTSQAIVISSLLLLLAGNECPADAISDLVGQVSQSQYTTYQLTIEQMGLGAYGGADYNQGFRDRFVDEEGGATLGNQEARLYLSDQLMSMGLDVSTQGLYQNVVGVKQGAVTPDQVYIVCAHYDTYEGSVDDERPGGEDNASGTAGMLEAARVLSQYEFESTIRFIGFNAEEINLLGSYDYVDNVLVAGGENVVGVINMDVIFGTFSFPRPPTPADLDVITAPLSPDPDEPHCPSCEEWANTFIRAANTYVPALPIDPRSPRGKEGPWPLWALGDQRSFLEQGYPAIWTSGGVTDHIHGSEDASDGLAGEFFDYAFATNVISAVVATITEEAKLILPGDYNGNGELDAGDLDLQAIEISNPPGDLAFDLNGDHVVDFEDRNVWVEDLKNTWFGDANLDLEFNSSDLVQVFAQAKYEKPKNAGWAQGDWNGNTFFDSSDMVVAGARGCYEGTCNGPREAGPIAANAVPEPGGWLLLALAAVSLAPVFRRVGHGQGR